MMSEIKVNPGVILMTLFIGIFIFDLMWFHPSVYLNEPTIGYFFIKLLIVGAGTFGVWFLLREWDPILSLLMGVVAGTLLLQLYYGFNPIPMIDGTSVQLTLGDSILGGTPVHGFGFLMGVISAFVISKMTPEKQIRTASIVVIVAVLVISLLFYFMSTVPSAGIAPGAGPVLY